MYLLKGSRLTHILPMFNNTILGTAVESEVCCKVLFLLKVSPFYSSTLIYNKMLFFPNEKRRVLFLKPTTFRTWCLCVTSWAFVFADLCCRLDPTFVRGVGSKSTLLSGREGLMNPNFTFVLKFINKDDIEFNLSPHIHHSRCLCL